METFLIYSGKVILTSGVLFLYYQLFLKDKTFHHYNRFYLLVTMLVSLLLPLLKVSYFTLEVNNDIYLLINKLNNSNSKIDDHDFNIFKSIAYGFGLVSVFFLTRFFIGIIKISKLKNQFSKENIEGINFYQTNLENAPFSYFRNLFWKNTIHINSDLGKQILKHEMVHIEQKHTLDKIFIEIIKSIFWFNPFFYFIHKEIHLIHEYLADKKAVKQSDTKAFAQMLLASHFSGEMLPATSPFLHSNLKKRLKMLKKPKTKFSYARRIFALPFVFTVAFAYLVNAKNKEIKATNIEIEKAVEQIKKDTIRAEIVPIEEPETETIQKSKDNISELSKEIAKKSSDLKTLKPDSKEFSDKVDEISSLSNKISDITNSDDFKKNMDKMTLMYSDNVVQNRLNEVLKKMNSPEFKEKMRKNQEYFNSDEWKNKVKDLGNVKIMSLNNPDFAVGFDGTEIFENHPELFLNSEKNAKLSEKDKKKLEAIAREKAKLAKKREEISKKQAELARKAAELAEQNFRTLAVNKFPNEKNGIYVNGKNLGSTNNQGNDINKAKLFIDGKEIPKEDFDKIKPDTISAIYVNKNDKVYEIRVKTK